VLSVAGGLFDERVASGPVSQLTENVFRYAVWRANQQQRGTRKFAYDIQTVPALDGFQTAKKGPGARFTKYLTICHTIIVSLS